MFGSYMNGLRQIEDLMNKGELENAMFELNNLEKGIALNEDEKLACMLLNSHILNKNGNFDKSLMLSKVAFRKSMELNNPLLVVDSTITFLESVKGLGMLEETSSKDKKEFLKAKLELSGIGGCAECGAYKGKSVDTIIQKIEEGIFKRQNGKLVCKKCVAKKKT